MTTPDKPTPELGRALQEMLQAEVAFARAFALWQAAPDRPERRRAVDEVEHRLDEALRAAQRCQRLEDDE